MSGNSDEVHPAATRHDPVGHITTGKFCQMRRGVEEIPTIPLVQMVIFQHVKSIQIHLTFKETRLKSARPIIGYFLNEV